MLVPLLCAQGVPQATVTSLPNLRHHQGPRVTRWWPLLQTWPVRGLAARDTDGARTPGAVQVALGSGRD